jgi:tetratricopeptide (TPR) repeat protein
MNKQSNNILSTYTPEIQEYFNQALIDYRAGNATKAIEWFEKILAQEPECKEALKLMAMLHWRNQNIPKAINYYEQLIKILPNDIDTYNQLAFACFTNKDYEKSAFYYQKIIDLGYKSATVYQGLADSLAKQNKRQEAIKFYDLALEFEPENATVHWNRALALLKLGNLKEGFIEFEYRKEIPHWRQLSEWKGYYLEYPNWDGSSLNGESVLIYYTNEGYGDIFLFVRYAALIKARGGKVFVLSPKPLTKLLKTVEEVTGLVEIESEQDLPEFDIYVSLTTLPLCFETTLETIPANIPYLKVPQSEDGEENKLLNLRELLVNKNFKIGIVWSSGQRERFNADNPYYRDCPLEFFIKLLSIPNVNLYSLQVGRWADEINQYQEEESNLYDLTPYIKDFADTATIISQLDLVIAVDTAVVHLAGAMGKPVWTILAFDADWRWLENRQDSPWYPTMRLFRQPNADDWESVFEEVISALKHHLNKG